MTITTLCLRVWWEKIPLLKDIGCATLLMSSPRKETEVVIPCARNTGEKCRPVLCPKRMGSTFLRATEYVAAALCGLATPLSFCFILSTALGVSITQQGKPLRLSEILMNRRSMNCAKADYGLGRQWTCWTGPRPGLGRCWGSPSQIACKWCS